MRQMLLLRSPSSEGKAMQNSRCTPTAQRLVRLAFSIHLSFQRAYHNFHFSLSPTETRRCVFFSAYLKQHPQKRQRSGSLSLAFHHCEDSAGPYAPPRQVHGPFVPSFPSATLGLIFTRMLKNKVFSKRI